MGISNISDYLSQYSICRTYMSENSNTASEDVETKKENEQDTVSITEEARQKMMEERQKFMEKLVAIQNAENIRESNDASKDYIEEQQKIMIVFRRISNGDKVPYQDEKKLLEYDPKMYQMAKSAALMAMMEKKRERKEYDSLWEDDENQTQQTAESSLDIGTEMKEFVEQQEVMHAQSAPVENTGSTVPGGTEGVAASVTL